MHAPAAATGIRGGHRLSGIMGSVSERRMLESQTDEDGVVCRWVALGDDGTLVIAGQDIGAIVERFFGDREYEFARSVAPEDLPLVRELLGVGAGDDLLDAIATRFTEPGGSARLERLLADGGVPTRFWSRTGD
jgi:hypothetical protein